jgi:D-alanine-D-alanine ligase
MDKRKIAVITGGFTAEANISLLSAATVLKYVDQQKYQAFKIVIDHSGWYYENNSGEKTMVDKNDFSIQVAGQKINFDLAFIALHGSPAEDGKLQGYFDMIGVKYTGSNVLPLALSFDKASTKKFLANSGIHMARSLMFHAYQSVTDICGHVLKGLKLPVFVKPNKNGSSYGVTKVNVAEALQEAVIKGFEFDDELIIEEFITGRELTCGVAMLEGKLIALPPTEIKSQNEFFDYKAKYLGQSQEITPAEITEEQTSKIQALSKHVFAELGLKGFARMDFILHEESFYFLEANTVPGLTDESLIPQQARAAGIPLETFFNSIIAAALM